MYVYIYIRVCTLLFTFDRQPTNMVEVSGCCRDVDVEIELPNRIISFRDFGWFEKRREICASCSSSSFGWRFSKRKEGCILL